MSASDIPKDARLEPMPGRVVIRVEQPVNQMYGGILYLPQQSAGQQTVGVVEAVYDPYVDDAQHEIIPILRVGDRVFFGKYSGTEVVLNRQTFIVCRETDILSIIRGKVEIVQDETPNDLHEEVFHE